MQEKRGRKLAPKLTGKLAGKLEPGYARDIRTYQRMYKRNITAKR